MTTIYKSSFIKTYFAYLLIPLFFAGLFYLAYISTIITSGFDFENILSLFIFLALLILVTVKISKIRNIIVTSENITIITLTGNNNLNYTNIKSVSTSKHEYGNRPLVSIEYFDTASGKDKTINIIPENNGVGSEEKMAQFIHDQVSKINPEYKSNDKPKL